MKTKDYLILIAAAMLTAIGSYAYSWGFRISEADDVSTADREDGYVLSWDESRGQHVYAAGGTGGGSTVSINGTEVTDPNFINGTKVTFSAAGSNITASLVDTYLTAEVDGSITNELQNIWETVSSQSGNTTASSTTDTLTINGAGIATTAISGDTLTITATEVDGNIGNEYPTAGNDTDISSNTQVDIEAQLDYVTTISRASSDLTLQTTTSGNILLNPAGNVGVGTTTVSNKLQVSGNVGAGGLVVNGDTITDFTGTGLSVVGGALTAAGGSSQWDDISVGISYTDGNVGIGTSAPAGLFSVANNLVWDNTNKVLKNGNYAVTDAGTGAPFDVSAITWAHYKMNDNAATTTIVDSVNGYNLTNAANTSAKTTTGKINQALTFNGTTDYSDTTTGISALANLTAGGFSLWIKETNTTDHNVVLAFGKLTAGSNSVIYLDIDSRAGVEKLVIAMLLDGTVQWEYNMPTNSFNAYYGNWVHVALRHDGNQPYLYINGVLDTTGSFSTSTNKTKWFKAIFTDATNKATDFLLSSYPLNALPVYPITSVLDDVRVFTADPGATNITGIYNGGNGSDKESDTGGYLTLTNAVASIVADYHSPSLLSTDATGKLITDGSIEGATLKTSAAATVGTNLTVATDSLTVNGTTDLVTMSGNVGIGTTSAATPLEVNGFIRTTTTNYRRYYHANLYSSNPGNTGPTWTVPSGNNLAGWQLNAAGELLNFSALDVHADWDGASDLHGELRFALLAAGAAPTDTVDIKCVLYYQKAGQVATRSQTIESAIVVGAAAQYTQFEAGFTINWDEASNVVTVGDQVCAVCNLETDTSEVDDILAVGGSFYYNTKHTGIESGDI